jgi:hypothetical protein
VSWLANHFTFDRIGIFRAAKLHRIRAARYQARALKYRLHRDVLQARIDEWISRSEASVRREKARGDKHANKLAKVLNYVAAEQPALVERARRHIARAELATPTEGRES